jgi:hypothetical protein
MSIKAEKFLSTMLRKSGMISPTIEYALPENYPPQADPFPPDPGQRIF